MPLLIKALLEEVEHPLAQTDLIYLTKAQESLDGAESELANGRYNNCANRCYYSVFQAAIAALIQQGVVSQHANEWSHSFVQAGFAGELIVRRKRFPSEMRDTLSRLMVLRHAADYQAQQVSETQAVRALRRAEQFLGAITSKGSES
jgi:uncharacterized protein (UPF0332 family)